MASATMDPELLDVEPPGEAAEPDDLLSKMIGEEVDNLLAEAEAARLPGAREAVESPVADTPVAEAPAVEPALAPQAAPPVDPVAAAATDEVIAGQVDDLIKGMAETEPPAVTTPAAAPASRPPAAAEATPPDADEAARLKVLATELEVDKAAGAAAAPDAVPAMPEGAAVSPDPAVPISVPVAVEAEPRISLLLRPLILINGPFAGFSDSTRSFMGKTAIITLINAIGVLTYVLVFRKHR